MREIIYLSLRCHHQNDSCVKTGSDGSHSNLSLIARDKVKRQRPQTTTFFEGDPKRNRAEALLLTIVTKKKKQKGERRRRKEGESSRRRK